MDDGIRPGSGLSPADRSQATGEAGEQVSILPLTDDDVGSLVSMYRDYAPEDRSMGLPPVDEREIRAWVGRLHERGTGFVAWLGDDIVAHAGFVPRKGDDAEFFIYVHRRAQGRGLGTELTRHVCREAAAGLDALVLYVARDNDAALAVFRKAGFTVTDRQPLDFEMYLSLTPMASPESSPASIRS
ncbi:GNAT family N-acetyltransferase [Halogranum amylolyticum]|uniref:GNAT family N-acetyltransferase n=1 Tax=Halogranum amylolyticum TaxID=660520 RepID=UPI00147B1DC3|nr:GNAT family N-acetyltransferase [Halogranum amylolyticum]